MPRPAAVVTALVLSAAAGGAVAAPPPSPGVAPAVTADAPAGGSGAAVRARWTWPLDPAPAVLRGFDDVTRYAPGHRGVDLAAAPGQPVLAPAAGRVVFAGPVAGRTVLVLLHGDGLRSSVEPVVPLVAVGAEVRAGEAVAAVAGTPAHCAAPCLHLGARRGEDYLDPLALLTPAEPPVLLPLGGPG